MTVSNLQDHNFDLPWISSVTWEELISEFLFRQRQVSSRNETEVLFIFRFILFIFTVQTLWFEMFLVFIHFKSKEFVLFAYFVCHIDLESAIFKIH